MCLSVFLSIVIGMYLFLTSLAMLVHEQRYKKMLHECYASAPLLNLCGCIGLILGLLLVVGHNIWVSDWPVLVTIIGWVTLLMGAYRIFAPAHFVKNMKALQAKKGYDFVVWVCLLVGIYMVWAGVSNS